MTDFLEVFGDEAGNTGNALLDPDQSHFVFATVAMSNAEAEALIHEARKLFPVQMPELKAKKLMASTRGRDLVAHVIAHIAERATVCAHDKLVALCGHMFEYIYEPVYQNDPAIFYQKDLHRFVAMYAYLFFSDPKGQGAAAMQQFQAYMRSLDEADAPLFFGPMVQSGDQPDHPFHAVLKFARGYRDIIIADNKRMHTSVPDAATWVLDLASSSLWSHLNHWGRKNKPLKVACDASKPLEAIAPHLDGSENDPAIRRARAVMGKTEPLGWTLAEPIAFVSSHQNPAVQVADILAGTTFWLLRNGGSPDDFVETAKIIDTLMLKDSIFPDFDLLDLNTRAAAVNWLMLFHLSTLAEAGADPYENIAAMYWQAEVSWAKGEFKPVSD